MSRTRAIARRNSTLTARWSFEAIDFGPIWFIISPTKRYLELFIIECQ